MADESSTTISVDALLELTGTAREAKAYAFLYAAFRKTEISANPVRDALDCLTPFIVPHLNSIAGSQVKIDNVQSYLKGNFGFDIPLYAIEQLIIGLQNSGYVEWNKTFRSYIAKRHENQYNIVKGEIETDFDEVVSALTSYAQSVGYPTAPPSGTWGEALIAFLKTSTDRPGPKAIVAKGALIDPGKAQFAVVGVFVRRLYAQNQDAFKKLLRVFMGVLVEEFISSVSELKMDKSSGNISVLYDTAVLLRLLGTSGKMLQAATAELTRYLQDLGFNIYYFGGNESEVANIFNTIVFLKDSGKELEGETAEAISTGEVSITDIRILQNAFPERLAALNVFPAEALEANAQANARYQIDEKGFEAYLLSQANKSGRAYSAQNREHDARYLGTIMRLRGGQKTRDLTNCGYLFVTTNKFLAQTSRRYLIDEKAIHPQTCPPILSVGQVATIAWLMKDQKLAPEKAGRELLSNCFAAVRPDAEWFRYFREGIGKATGSLEEYGSSSRNTLTLQAARRIAQEESFGSSALVRELNMAEILSRAESERDALLEDQQAQIEAIRAEADQERQKIVDMSQAERAELAKDIERQALEAERLRKDAVRLAEEEAARLTETLVLEAKLAVGRKNAKLILNASRAFLIFLFLLVTTWALYLRTTQVDPTGLFVLSAIIAVISVFSFCNLIGVPVVKVWFESLEDKLASKLST